MASSNNPVIITCAITGAETTRERQPNLPITPCEQGEAAEACVKAGASIIHLHVREDDGKPSQSPERFDEAIREMKKRCPDVIIQISTGWGSWRIDRESGASSRTQARDGLAQFGTMNFGDDVFYNHPRDILGLAAKMHQYGVIPELEIYEVGMLETAFRLAKQGILRPTPFNVQFVLGVPGGMSGEPRNLVHLVDALAAGMNGKPAHWGVAGVGRFQLPLAVQAIVMGGHVRVGFEDNIFFSKASSRSQTRSSSTALRGFHASWAGRRRPVMKRGVPGNFGLISGSHSV